MSIFDGISATAPAPSAAPNRVADAVQQMTRANADLEQIRVIPTEKVTLRGGELVSYLEEPPIFDRERQVIFLEQLARVPNVALAALRAGILPQQAHQLAAESEQFAIAMEAAKQIAGGAAHQEAYRRAIEGVDKKVFYQGAHIDTEKVYSDSLLARVLEAEVPGYERKSQIGLDARVNLNWAELLQLAQREVRSGEKSLGSGSE